MDAERAAELFAAVGPVRVRRMFGGAGVFSGDVMFALIAGDGLFVKADDALAARLSAQGSAPFRYARRDGRAVALSYWRLPDDALDDPDLAAGWGRAALAVARG
jgi:DNA transformation protein and related proteins